MPSFVDFADLINRIDTRFGELEADKISRPQDGGTFDPTAVDLTQGQIEYNNYTQIAAITLGLSGTPAIGGSATVNILGGGFAVNFSSPFIGVDGITSGIVLEDGKQYPFYFRAGIDWVETSPGVFEDRVLVGALGLVVPDPRPGGLIDWGAIPIDGSFWQFDDWTQDDAVEVVIAAGTPQPGSGGRIVVIGGDFSMTWPAEFRASNPARPLSSVLLDGGIYAFTWLWNAELGTSGLFEVFEDGPSGGVGTHASAHLTGGTDPIPVATTSTSGLMSAADKVALGTKFVFEEFLRPDDQTYSLIGESKFAGVISTLDHFSISGTCTVALKINSVAVTGISAVAISSTPGTATATAANTVAIGDRIEVTFSGCFEGLPERVNLTVNFA